MWTVGQAPLCPGRIVEGQREQLVHNVGGGVLRLHVAGGVVLVVNGVVHTTRALPAAAKSDARTTLPNHVASVYLMHGRQRVRRARTRVLFVCAAS